MVYNRDYYLKNKDKIREKHREWYKQNKERHIELSKLNKRRIKTKLRELLGNKCAICGSTTGLIFHHLGYRNKSGKPTYKDYELGYLVLLCRKCHGALNYLGRLKKSGKIEQILSLLPKNSIYVSR